jgi:hypothetical protein
VNEEYEERLKAIQMYLDGANITDICNDLNRTRPWFYKWLNRYEIQGVEGLESRSRAPLNVANKTSPAIETEIVKIRGVLQAGNSPETKYAHIGADSIQWELERDGIIPVDNIPSTSTINRIIKRSNLSKPNRVPRRPSLPYPGPEVIEPNSVHQFDTIGPRFINGENGAERFYCINLIDCFSKMTCKVITENIQGSTLLSFLINNVWSVIGIPQVLQVDNMLAFKGSNKYPRSISQIVKWCLYLGVEVLFIPVNEPQRNGFVERSNGNFDLKFFRAQKFNSLVGLREELEVYNNAVNIRYSNSTLKKHIHGARTPYEVHFMKEPRLLKNFKEAKEDLNNIKIPEGKISFIRFVKKDCKLSIFSEKFDLPRTFKYNYVRATIDTGSQTLLIKGNNDVYEIDYKMS